MSNDNLTLGDVVLARFPSHYPPGHEQEGLRPALVVGTPYGQQRFSTVIVAPLTTVPGPWGKRNRTLYPQLPTGIAGLHNASTVLLDQVRALDAGRLTAYLGTVPNEPLRAIRSQLLRLFI